ncbi:MAG: STAS domain-containing protein [Sedimentisphaerales bacterium]|nr:STAS domain-containing protein [Sedimentisphaerales bacterium]
MGIQDWSETVVLVTLAEEPQMGEELRTVIDIVRDRGNCDVVIDFGEVDIITSSSIAKILKLRKALKDANQRLVLCGIKNATRGIFMVTGLDSVFEFVDDKFIALASLQLIN